MLVPFMYLLLPVIDLLPWEPGDNRLPSGELDMSKFEIPDDISASDETALESGVSSLSSGMSPCPA